LPTPENVIFFETPAQLRAWFEANHEKAAELWLGYHLKRTGRPSVTWQDVVDVELCFGWIDSVRYSLGDDRSAQRITPRRKGSVWSAINIKRFTELERDGLVHPAAQPGEPALVGQVPGLLVRIAGLAVELDGPRDGRVGLVPVRLGDGQETALELRPRP